MAVYNHPFGRHLVVDGPPGTGKTALAVWRAARLHSLGLDVRVLTKYRALNLYVAASLSALGANGQVTTFDAYFKNDLWPEIEHSAQEAGIGSVSNPVREGDPPWPTNGGGRFDYDWETIVGIFDPSESSKHPHLVIDEAQDLPSLFWTLAPELAPTISVFADEAQRLERSTNSLIDQIRRPIARDTRDHVTLAENHRNTPRIHDVACLYYRGSTPPVRPSESDGLGDMPEAIRFNSEAAQFDYIARLARDRVDWHIGVLVPETWHRERAITELNARASAGNATYAVQGYIPAEWVCGRRVTQEVAPDWTKPGVVVLTYKSAKGLQFEHVVLPELERTKLDLKDEFDCNTLYVMLTRAARKLTVSWVAGASDPEPHIVATMPSTHVERIGTDPGEPRAARQAVHRARPPVPAQSTTGVARRGSAADSGVVRARVHAILPHLVTLIGPDDLIIRVDRRAMRAEWDPTRELRSGQVVCAKLLGTPSDYGLVSGAIVACSD